MFIIDRVIDRLPDLEVVVLVEQLDGLMVDCIRLLESRGIGVGIFQADHTHWTSSITFSEQTLFVVKANTSATIAFARLIRTRGGRLFSRLGAILRIRDRMRCTTHLQDSGVPTPSGRMVRRRTEILDVLKDSPVVLKPLYGSRGHQVRLITSAADLELDFGTGGPFFAQAAVHPAISEFKVYRIGDHVCCCQMLGARREVVAHSECERLVVKTSRAFGVDLCSIDVIHNGVADFVVDVNHWGSFQGFPEGARHVADLIEFHWRFDERHKSHQLPKAAG